MNRDEIFELIEANGLTLHGDIEHFAALVADRVYAKYMEQPIPSQTGVISITIPEPVAYLYTLPNPWRVPVQTFTSLLEGMPQMSCMNTMTMHSRQSDEDRAERLAFAIEDRAAELLKHGEACDPMDGFNICEALDESSTNEKMVLGKVLAERKFDQAGILVASISQSYWAKKADEMARDELA